jgi:hypothetical protein
LNLDWSTSLARFFFFYLSTLENLGEFLQHRTVSDCAKKVSKKRRIQNSKERLLEFLLFCLLSPSVASGFLYPLTAQERVFQW